MKIKIKAIKNLPAREACNIDKLTKALDDVNGRAKAHTADWDDVIQAAIHAERDLDNLNILKRDRKGAKYVFVSGDPVSSAYSNKAWWRVATRVVLERGAQPGTWYVTEISRTEIGSEGGSYTTYLTPEQTNLAIDHFCKQFEVISQPITEAAA